MIGKPPPKRGRNRPLTDEELVALCQGRIRIALTFEERMKVQKIREQRKKQ